MQAFCGCFRVLAVDRFDLQQSEISFIFLGRPTFAGYQIACTKIELANLRGGDINILCARQIIDRPKKPKPSGRIQTPCMNISPLFSACARKIAKINSFFFIWP